jgi:hypothetical protein
MNVAPRNLTTESPMSLVSSAWMTPAAAPRTDRLSDDLDRFATPRFCAATDEVLAVDERSELTPSQAVENRLVALLKEASLPVSHLQVRRGLMVRGRRDD